MMGMPRFRTPFSEEIPLPISLEISPLRIATQLHQLAIISLAIRLAAVSIFKPRISRVIPDWPSIRKIYLLRDRGVTLSSLVAMLSILPAPPDAQRRISLVCRDWGHAILGRLNFRQECWFRSISGHKVMLIRLTQTASTL